MLRGHALRALRAGSISRATTRTRAWFSTSQRFDVNFQLNEEQTALDDMSKQFAREVIQPVAADHDQSGEFPWEIVSALKRALCCAHKRCFSG